MTTNQGLTDTSARWVRVKNMDPSQLDIPAFGIVEIAGDSDSNGVFPVQMPTSDGSKMVLILSGGNLPYGFPGQASWASPIPCRYDPNDGTPVVGEVWGPAAGTWLLRKGKSGFRIFGTPARNVVNVVRDPTAWGEPASLVRVKNTTGSAIPSHRAVKPTSVLTDITEGREFTRHPVLVVALPATETDLVFVTLEPIPNGEIGRAAVMGMALIELSVSDTAHMFAKPASGGVGLVSAPRGPLRLVIAPSATGNVKLPALLSNWWLVQVACSGGSIAVTY